VARANFFGALTVALVAALLTSLLAGLQVGTAKAQEADPGGQQVEATGLLTPVFPPHTYSHLLNDVTGGFYFVRSSVVDLYSFDDGQRVTVRGTLVNDGELPQPILEVTQLELAPEPEPVTATFELAVEGQPPTQTTFFGMAGLGTEGSSVQLLDPDGDGVFAGSVEIPQGTQRGVLIEQGTGAGENPVGFRFPGEPRSVIRDFGLVTFDGDKAFSASVSFEQATTDAGDSGDLPNTGYPSPLLLATLAIAGALLVASSLLTRRLFRRSFW